MTIHDDVMADLRDDLKTYKGAWTNLYIWNGGSRLGEITYESEKSAQDGLIELCKEEGRINPKTGKKYSVIVCWADGFEKRVREMSMMFPIPVGES